MSHTRSSLLDLPQFPVPPHLPLYYYHLAVTANHLIHGQQDCLVVEPHEVLLQVMSPTPSWRSAVQRLLLFTDRQGGQVFAPFSSPVRPSIGRSASPLLMQSRRDTRSVQEKHLTSERIGSEQQEVRDFMKFRADEAVEGKHEALSILSEAEFHTGLHSERSANVIRELHRQIHSHRMEIYHRNQEYEVSRREPSWLHAELRNHDRAQRDDRTAGKGFNSLSHYNLVHKFISNENPGRGSHCWQGGRKARKIASMANDESQGRKRGH